MITKQALTIGINAYDPSRLTLRPCRNDATDLSTSLRTMGFQVQNGLDMSLNAMQSAIRQFVNSIQPGAIALFYFSGHGVQSDGENYLIPTNARGIHAENIKSTAVNPQHLVNSMYQRKPRLIICILDCCRTQPPDNPLDEAPRHRALAGTRPGLGIMRAPPSTIFAYACDVNSTASAVSKNGRNSLYTYYLLRYITAPNVDIDRVFQRVGADVQRSSNNQQIPFRYTSCNEQICLMSNQRQMMPVERQLIQPKPAIRMLFSFFDN